MRCILLGLFFLCPFGVFAQSLTGTWHGVGLSQDSADPQNTTTRLELVQSGTELRGILRTKLDRKQYAASSILGTIMDSTVQWAEYDVLKDETAGDESTQWCFTRFSGKLKITGKGCYIQGVAKSSGLVYNAGTQLLTPGVCPESRERYFLPGCVWQKSKATGKPRAMAPPEALLDSKVQIVDSLIVNSTVLHIRYKDGDEVDGDRVSLYMDTVVLGRNLKLTARYKSMYSLVMGKVAYFILYADEAGRGGEIAQATTGLVFLWGRNNRRVMELNPSKGQSKAIKIIVKE